MPKSQIRELDDKLIGQAIRYGINIDIAGINLCRDHYATEAEYTAAYDTWKQEAIRLIDNDPQANVEKLKTFVQLSFFRSLEITEMMEGDAQWLDKLCECYMGLPGKSFNALYTNEAQTANNVEKAAYLANHLSQLLTNLNSVKHYFQAGYIRLISTADVNQKLTEATNKGVQAPFILRVSNSRPHELAISYTYEGIIKHALCNEDQSWSLDEAGKLKENRQIIAHLEFIKKIRMEKPTSDNQPSTKQYRTEQGELIKFELKTLQFPDKNIKDSRDKKVKIYSFTKEFLDFIISPKTNIFKIPLKTAVDCNNTIPLEEVKSSRYATATQLKYNQYFSTNNNYTNFASNVASAPNLTLPPEVPRDPNGVTINVLNNATSNRGSNFSEVPRDFDGNTIGGVKWPQITDISAAQGASAPSFTLPPGEVPRGLDGATINPNSAQPVVSTLPANNSSYQKLGNILNEALVEEEEKLINGPYKDAIAPLEQLLQLWEMQNQDFLHHFRICLMHPVKNTTYYKESETWEKFAWKSFDRNEHHDIRGGLAIELKLPLKDETALQQNPIWQKLIELGFRAYPSDSVSDGSKKTFVFVLSHFPANQKNPSIQPTISVNKLHELPKQLNDIAENAKNVSISQQPVSPVNTPALPELTTVRYDNGFIPTTVGSSSTQNSHDEQKYPFLFSSATLPLPNQNDDSPNNSIKNNPITETPTVAASPNNNEDATAKLAAQLLMIAGWYLNKLKSETIAENDQDGWHKQIKAMELKVLEVYDGYLSATKKGEPTDQFINKLKKVAYDTAADIRSHNFMGKNSRIAHTLYNLSDELPDRKALEFNFTKTVPAEIYTAKTKHTNHATFIKNYYFNELELIINTYKHHCSADDRVKVAGLLQAIKSTDDATGSLRDTIVEKIKGWLPDGKVPTQGALGEIVKQITVFLDNTSYKLGVSKEAIKSASTYASKREKTIEQTQEQLRAYDNLNNNLPKAKL